MSFHWIQDAAWLQMTQAKGVTAHSLPSALSDTNIVSQVSHVCDTQLHSTGYINFHASIVCTTNTIYRSVRMIVSAK